MITKQILQQVRDNAESARYLEWNAKKASYDAKSCANAALYNIFKSLALLTLQFGLIVVSAFMIGYTFMVSESMIGLAYMAVYFFNASFMIFYSQETNRIFILSCNEFRLFWSLYRYCNELIHDGRVRVGTATKFRMALERMEELV